MRVADAARLRRAGARTLGRFTVTSRVTGVTRQFATALASEIRMPETRTHLETRMEYVPIDRKQAQKVAHPEWFTGPVHMQYLTKAELSQELEVIAVFFEIEKLNSLKVGPRSEFRPRLPK